MGDKKVVFTSLSMIICTLVPILLFSSTQLLFHIVPDNINLNLLLKTIGYLLVSIIVVIEIGLLAMEFGFTRKTLSATIVSALIFTSILGNFVIGKVNKIVLSSSIILSLIIIVTLLFFILRKIDLMEA